MMAVQPGGSIQGDEELAASGVGAGIGHGQDPFPAVSQAGTEFVVDGVARAAHAGAGGIPALDHEAVDDPVENDPVIESLLHQLPEVPGGFGSLVLKQLRSKISQIRMEMHFFVHVVHLVVVGLPSAAPGNRFCRGGRPGRPSNHRLSVVFAGRPACGPYGSGFKINWQN
jgi:hypothetical protein